MINYQRYRSILCLNGDLPSADFFHSSLPIIAADGAANTLMAMNIKPDWAVGDLDSIAPEYRQEINCVYDPNQDTCDFQKSLSFLAEKNLLPAIITGVNGGCLDHILKNVGLIAGTTNLLVAPPIIGFSLTAGESDCYTVPKNTKISIIGLPHAIVSSQGLKWELTHFKMQFPGKNSFYNQAIDNKVTLSVLEGSVLVLIYSLYNHDKK